MAAGVSCVGVLVERALFSWCWLTVLLGGVGGG